jgi:hypothetical protein
MLATNKAAAAVTAAHCCTMLHKAHNTLSNMLLIVIAQHICVKLAVAGEAQG